MKILILGLGAFGFAIGKLLGDNNKDREFLAYEINNEITQSLKKTRKHPYFFNGETLPENIKIIESYDNIINEIDLLIIAIPAQYIGDTILKLKANLKDGITILNLAKGIDIKSNKCISNTISGILSGKPYNYSVLSGGMIASELVEGKKLGADLGIINIEIGRKIVELLENNNLEIVIREDILNIELYGSLKNIAAILTGYHEGKGDNLSTIGYYLTKYINEMKLIIELYGGNKNIDFGYYSFGGDLIATCFGDSRNRYLGKLLGEGNNIEESLVILKKENKHAEGYKTLKAVYKIIKNKSGFETTKFLYNLIK